MEKEKRYDLRISGLGSSGGGVFNQVIIDGQGTVNGDTDCIDFKLNGVGTINGNVKAKIGKISGKGEIKGDLEADDFKINGYANIDGSAEVKLFRLEGLIKIKGNAKAERIENRGAVEVYGDCNSEVFISKGGFNIGGLLNGGSIEIDLYAPCRAKEIGGEKIRANVGKAFSLRRLIKSMFPSLDINTGLCAEVIEGDDIYLEYTKARVVRGGNVIIGEGCEIELVEYKNSFDKSEKSVVADSKKI